MASPSASTSGSLPTYPKTFTAIKKGRPAFSTAPAPTENSDIVRVLGKFMEHLIDVESPSPALIYYDRDLKNHVFPSATIGLNRIAVRPASKNADGSFTSMCIEVSVFKAQDNSKGQSFDTLRLNDPKDWAAFSDDISQLVSSAFTDPVLRGNISGLIKTYYGSVNDDGDLRVDLTEHPQNAQPIFDMLSDFISFMLYMLAINPAYTEENLPYGFLDTLGTLLVEGDSYDQALTEAKATLKPTPTSSEAGSEDLASGVIDGVALLETISGDGSESPASSSRSGRGSVSPTPSYE